MAVPPVITHVWEISLFPMRGSLVLEPHGELGQGWLWASRGSEAGGRGRRRTAPRQTRADGVHGAAREGLSQSMSPSGLKVSGRTEGKRGDCFYIWPFRRSCIERWGCRHLPCIWACDCVPLLPSFRGSVMSDSW